MNNQQVNKFELEKKNLKTGALVTELAVIIVAIMAMHVLMELRVIHLPISSCNLPIYKPEVVGTTDSLDMGDSWDDIADTVCKVNTFAKMVGYIGFPYLLLCALMIASPLKRTPTMFYTGTYLLNEKGEKPQFHEALKLVLFSLGLLPIYVAYAYFFYHDFAVTMHQLFNMSFLFGGAGAFFLFLEVFRKSDLTADEQASGLRYHLIEKKEEGLKKRNEKRVKWYNKPAYSVVGYKVVVTLRFLIFGFFAINVMREVGPPKDYNEIIYKRPATVWKDNAYFALAGLDAPADVQNFYEFGRQEVIYHSGRYTRFKKEIGVPYVDDVPESDFSLKPDDISERLAFDDGGLELWGCFNNIAENLSLEDCSDKDKILELINANSQVWERFCTLPDYSVFSLPDKSLEEDFYSGSEFIDLARLNVIYILDLQAQGRSAQAMEEWLRYMDLYLKIINEPSNMVEKAVFLVVLGIQYHALEPLLYNDPGLVISYGDRVQKLFDITDVNYFGAGDLLANDWRVLEPAMLSPTGVVHHHRKLLYKCVEENKTLASLPADEYFKMQDFELCHGIYGDIGDDMLTSVVSPGNPISNIIYYLVMGGVVKGGEIIANMYRFVADMKMATVAVELIRNDVAPEGVEDYLKTMPETYWNPITKSPFSWDEEKQQLYYFNPTDNKGTSVRSFHVNLSAE
jgi:hypothetical protein